MKQYLCIAQVYVDSLYLPGETIELTDEQATALGDSITLMTEAKDEPAVVTTKSIAKAKG